MPRFAKSRQRSAARLFGQNVQGALVVSALILMVLVGGVYGGISSSQTKALAAANRALQERAQELSTGSLLFVPLFGDRCRRMMIDNATWNVIDKGIVSCSDALNPPGAKAQNVPSALVEGLRDSFQSKE